MDNAQQTPIRERTTHRRVPRIAITELKPGDVLHIYTPFEENTPDYFNGHHPRTIREQDFQNRRKLASIDGELITNYNITVKVEAMANE